VGRDTQAPGEAASPPVPEPVVCELSRRGKLLVGEPYFEPRTPIVLDRKTASDAERGDLVVVATGRGRARIERVLRPQPGAPPSRKRP